jgi:hypothetical protein
MAPWPFERNVHFTSMGRVATTEITSQVYFFAAHKISQYMLRMSPMDIATIIGVENRSIVLCGSDHTWQNKCHNDSKELCVNYDFENYASCLMQNNCHLMECQLMRRVLLKRPSNLQSLSTRDLRADKWQHLTTIKTTN